MGGGPPARLTAAKCVRTGGGHGESLLACQGMGRCGCSGRSGQCLRGMGSGRAHWWPGGGGSRDTEKLPRVPRDTGTGRGGGSVALPSVSAGAFEMALRALRGWDGWEGMEIVRMGEGKKEGGCERRMTGEVCGGRRKGRAPCGGRFVRREEAGSMGQGNVGGSVGQEKEKVKGRGWRPLLAASLPLFAAWCSRGTCALEAQGPPMVFSFRVSHVMSGLSESTLGRNAPRTSSEK